VGGDGYPRREAPATAQPALVNFLSLRAKKYDSFLKIKVVAGARGMGGGGGAECTGAVFLVKLVNPPKKGGASPDPLVAAEGREKRLEILLKTFSAPKILGLGV